MTITHIVVLTIIFLLSLGLILRMIVNHQLREIYAFMWVVLAFFIPGVILCFPAIQDISGWFGLESPLEFTFFVCIFGLFGLCLHFSAQSSSQQRVLKNTVQKIALMEHEIEQLKAAEARREQASVDPVLTEPVRRAEPELIP